jgi:hypothetical protein
MTTAAQTAILLPTSAKNVLWKWNETDVSEFTVAKDSISGGSPTLSKQAGAHGPVFRTLFPTKTTGEQACFITINAYDIPQVNNIRRFVFRFRVVGFSGDNSWYAMGPAFNCNNQTGASFYGMAACGGAGVATRAVQISAGAISASNGTPVWVNLGQISTPNSMAVEFETEITQYHNGAPPEWRGNFLGVGANSNGTPHFTLSTSKAAWVADGGMTAFGSNWNSLTLSRVGICFYGSTGTTANQYWDIDNIEILKHPMDRS